MSHHIEGISIPGPSGPIMLKWHRLRLTTGDTDFTMRRLKQGLAAGASMEIDLRRHAEHGFVCLHDGVLESETTGRGAIHAAHVNELEQLRLRGPDGAPGPEPLLLLESLAAAVAETAHPQSVVQFDLKERLGDLDAATIAGFVQLVQPVARHILLSGDDWAAVRALGAQVPGLRLGFDPSELPEASRLVTVDDFARFTGFTIATAPEASIIYLQYRLVLAALAAGFDIISALHDASRTVDAWTLDLNSPQAVEDLAVLIGSGVDQISSNDCIAIERAAARLDLTRPPRPIQA